MTDDNLYFSLLRRHHLYDGLEEELCAGESLLVPGPAGALEVLTSCPACYSETRPLAVVCHPHPLYGGSLKNKVVHVLTQTFNSLGLLSVSFNFRGVGESGGRFDGGVGETDDLLAVVSFFRKRYPRAPLWLAGFSFGAYVAARGHIAAEAERLLLVAPPVTLFDFRDVPEIEVPWMVIQGAKDEVIAPAAVAEWVKGRAQRPVFRWMNDADHFFHGRLNRLRDSVTQRWGEALDQGPA